MFQVLANEVKDYILHKVLVQITEKLNFIVWSILTYSFSQKEVLNLP